MNSILSPCGAVWISYGFAMDSIWVPSGFQARRHEAAHVDSLINERGVRYCLSKGPGPRVAPYETDLPLTHAVLMSLDPCPIMKPIKCYSSFHCASVSVSPSVRKLCRRSISRASARSPARPLALVMCSVLVMNSCVCNCSYSPPSVRA